MIVTQPMIVSGHDRLSSHNHGSTHDHQPAHNRGSTHDCLSGHDRGSIHDRSSDHNRGFAYNHGLIPNNLRACFIRHFPSTIHKPPKLPRSSIQGLTHVLQVAINQIKLSIVAKGRCSIKDQPSLHFRSSALERS